MLSLSRIWPFSYPQRTFGDLIACSLTKPDKNIDHRRVPNLQTFFSRFGEKLAVTNDRSSYHAGNIVTWMLPGNLPHMGIISDKQSPISGNPMIVHNIGAGPKLEDMLFNYKITGHYRFVPDRLVSDNDSSNN